MLLIPNLSRPSYLGSCLHGQSTGQVWCTRIAAITLRVQVPKIVGFQGPKTIQSMDFGT